MNRYTNPKKRRAPTSSSNSNSGEEIVLSLDNSKSIPSVDVPDDDKVIKYLTKLETKLKFGSHYTAKLVLGLSETDYFASQQETLVKSLQNEFGINDFTISKHIPGCIDRIVSISGDSKAVAKACLFVAFITCAKLNKFIRNEVFTFKSSNYRLSLLVSVEEAYKIDSIGKSCNTKGCSSTHPLCYNFNDGVYLVNITGDFRSLFDFLNELFKLDSECSTKNSTINQIQIIGVHSDPHLYSRSDHNKKLETSFNEVLKFVYSKSVLEDEVT